LDDLLDHFPRGIDKGRIEAYESMIALGRWPRYGREMKDRRPMLIVIVDDDESVQSALRDLIEADGLSAKCFGSAEEFLHSGLQREAACLISDIRMPGMSGLELQARLKADGCKTPIIFITAHGDARMRIQTMREGAVEFLTKPFDDQVLLNRVRTALEM
jgi:FixJ family two-component response regulator